MWEQGPKSSQGACQQEAGVGTAVQALWRGLWASQVTAGLPLLITGLWVPGLRRSVSWHQLVLEGNLLIRAGHGDLCATQQASQTRGCRGRGASVPALGASGSRVSRDSVFP